LSQTGGATDQRLGDHPHSACTSLSIVSTEGLVAPISTNSGHDLLKRLWLNMLAQHLRDLARDSI